MTANAFVQRTFTVDDQDVMCRFFQPEAGDRDFGCRYEIEWPEGLRSRRAYGVDEVQALLLAMEMAHVELLVARNRNARRISWLDQRRLGLPVSEAIRDWDAEGSG